MDWREVVGNICKSMNRMFLLWWGLNEMHFVIVSAGLNRQFEGRTHTLNVTVVSLWRDLTDWLNTWLHLNYNFVPDMIHWERMETQPGQEHGRKTGGFTSLIFRTIPSCWRTHPSPLDHDEDSDGGFSEHVRRRTVSSVQPMSDRYSSLPISVGNGGRSGGRKHSVIYHPRPLWSNLRPHHASQRYLRQSHSVQTFRNTWQQ